MTDDMAEDLDREIRVLEAKGADLNGRLSDMERQLLGAEQRQHDLGLYEDKTRGVVDGGVADFASRLRTDLEASIGRLLLLMGAAMEDVLFLKDRLSALLATFPEESPAGEAVLLKGLASENGSRLRKVEGLLRRLRDVQGAYAEHRRRGLASARLEGALAVRDLELRLAALEGRQTRMCRTVRELFADMLALERREWLAGKHARQLRLQLDLLEARGGQVAAAAHRRLERLLEAEMAELVRRRGMLLRRHSWLLAEARGCSLEQTDVGRRIESVSGSLRVERGRVGDRLQQLKDALAAVDQAPSTDDALSRTSMFVDEFKSARDAEMAAMRRRSDVLRRVFVLLREGLGVQAPGRVRDDVRRQLDLLLLPEGDVDVDPQLTAVVCRIQTLLDKWCLCQQRESSQEEVGAAEEGDGQEDVQLKELRRSVLQLRGSCARIRQKLQAASDKFFPGPP